METKVIILSLRFWWFYLVYKGIKTIEIRKTYPKNFRGIVFVYVSKTNWKKDLMKIPENEREFFKQFVGKVGLCFECNKIGAIHNFIDGLEVTSIYDRHVGYMNEQELLKACCLSYDELLAYGGIYAIHISDLEIFDKPKELSEFKTRYYPQFAGMVKNKTHYELRQLTKAPQSWCYALPVCQE